MANLESTQLKDGFQTLVSIGTTTAGGHPSNPLLGALTNGKGNALTQVTLGLGSASAPSYSFTGDADTGMFSSGANALNLVTGGSTAIAIASGGNVAIGTNNISSAKLQVGTSSEEILRLERDTISNDSFIDLTYAAGHSDDSDANHEYSKIRTKVVANLENSESGELHFQTINSGTMGTAMVIDQAGLVGIGSTSGGVPNPAYALEVQANSTSGVLAVQNAANDRNTFRSSNAAGTRTLDIGNNSSGHGILNIRNSSGTVNTQLLGSGDSYFNGGNVGIGTSSPASTLQVEGDLDVRTASNKNLHIRSFPSFDNFSNQGVGISMSRTSSDADLMALGVVDTDKLGLFSRSGIILATGGSNAFQHTSEVVRIDGSGNVGIGTTSPSSMLNLNTTGTSNFGLKLSRNDSATDGFEFTYTPSNAEAFIENKYPASSGQVFGDIVFRHNVGGSQTERMRLEADGGNVIIQENVGIGTTSPENRLHIAGTNTVAMTLQAPTHDSSVASTATMNFKYQSSGGAAIGKIELVEKSTNSFSGKFVFGLPHSSSGQATRDVLTIDTDGSILPAIDDTADIGSSSNRFDNIFATNTTVTSSDRNQKQDFEQITEAEAKVAQKAKGLLTKYKWIKDVQKYGDDAQYHIGIIAQELIAAFEEEGLNYKKYAMIYESEHLEDSGEITTYYGVRYTELLAFIISTL